MAPDMARPQNFPLDFLEDPIVSLCRTSTKTAEVKKEEVREGWPAESRKKEG